MLEVNLCDGTLLSSITFIARIFCRNIINRLKIINVLLIYRYVKNNKEADNDWFRLESNKEGTRWFGKCWYIQNFLKYEFEVEFDIPVTYPTTAPEIALPELDGKTAKMYRGGKICLTDHFKPLWARNVPKFGIAHAMALGLGPWLAVEIPELIEKGVVVHKDEEKKS
ncbi:PREDICTED: ubiquitin-fold modifier-conjugating enzyme 1 isoform X2 [Wasmannia auropunctata]|uniref:ubiquitin-fold modifier-conjugating enzyme 1 isoform X2 n=1 Tax=Wasmannia auropunctata TaxID=64793 RepID=UPI0005F087D2|nr:PREDICTED: ubiquitin-fold modifier-conjugating enzyme 1 isoform X2 [Wasmannia auropunctata]